MEKQTYVICAIILGLFLVTNVMAVENTIVVGDYEVEYSYNGAQEGETFTLTVSVINIDDFDKSDVVLEINDDDPFSVRDDDEWIIGDLAVDESVTNTFRVEIDDGVSEDEYELEFTLEDSKRDYDDEFEIDVSSSIADLIVGDVTSFPLIISPDTKDIKLEVTIENLGGGDATFTRARLILPDGFESSSSYSDISNLGTIEAKGEKVATFYVNTLPEISSGVNNARLELEYKSDNKNKRDTLDFDLPVKGRPQFEIVSVSTTPLKVVPGDTATINVVVRNVGEEDGAQTSLRVFENSDLPITFDEKTNFIGTLKPGETGTATFSFDVDKDATPKDYLIKAETRTVNNDNVLVEDHNFPLRIYEAEGGNSVFLVFVVIVLIVVILLIVLIYLLVKRK